MQQPARAASGARLVSSAEQALEHQARVGLGRHRRRRAAPGEAVGVGAAVARVAVADHARVLAAELERGEPRLPADLLRGDLIDRDAVLDVGAGGLARMDAGQERRAGARVVAGAVAERVAVLVREAGQHQHVLAERLERLQDARELERAPSAPRRPVVHDDAVRDVGEGEPERRLGGLRGAASAGVIASSIGSATARPCPGGRAAGEMLAGDDHGAGVPVLAAARVRGCRCWSRSADVGRSAAASGTAGS